MTNDTTLRARLEERYGAEKIAAMTISEYSDAIRSTIRVVQSANDVTQATRDGHAIVAGLEFPNLSPADRSDIVRARMLP